MVELAVGVLQGVALKVQVPYSQHFIFFVTYEGANKYVLHYYIRLERLFGEKHSSLLDPFVSYKEKKVLRIHLQVPYSQHFIFFVTCVWILKARAFDYRKARKAFQ
jgi:hypothetical protein